MISNIKVPSGTLYVKAPPLNPFLLLLPPDLPLLP